MNKLRESLGIILLFLGIAIIAYPLFISFKIIEGERNIPPIFKELSLKKNEKVPMKLTSEKSDFQKDTEKKVRKIAYQEFSSLFPTKNITQLFNLIAWSALAGLTIFGGSQLSQLGIKLLKD